MEHILKIRVCYADTDCYGIVWHGNYFRWFEAGRVEFSRACGLNLSKLQEKDIVLPVVDISVRYKYSPKLDDELIIRTKIESISTTAITFCQTVEDTTVNQTCAIAKVKVVSTNNQGILYKRIPQILTDKLLIGETGK